MTDFRLIPRVFRTVRHLFPRQVSAQAIHFFSGQSGPVRSAQTVPELSSGASTLPFLEGPSHARWHEGDVLELINERVDFSSGLDWSYAASGPLWSYQLHNCDHLRGSELSAERRKSLMLDWIRNHESGVGWDPHPTSLRLVSWGKLLLGADKLRLDEAELAEISLSLARQANTLQANFEVRLQANHLFSNRLALVFSGLLFSGPKADRWLGQSEALVREMEIQFKDDGGHEERSPMYHSLLLESLLDLLNLARARPDRAPDNLISKLEEFSSRGLSALKLLCHPDGKIALFSDSAFDIAPLPEALAQYARTLGIEPAPLKRPGLLEATGYARLESDDFVLIVSVDAPSPPHQPGHAHCDALAFELSYRGERIVTDTGVYEYVVGERRDLSRATLSHATLEIGGTDQSEIWSAHRVGGRSQVRLMDFQAGLRLEASCVGWSTPDCAHHRVIALHQGGVEIRDRLEGSRKPVRLSLPLAPGIRARLIHDQDGDAEVHLVMPSGRRMRLSLPIEAEWRIEPHPYFPSFGVEVERERLIGEASAFESGTWRFECLG